MKRVLFTIIAVLAASLLSTAAFAAETGLFMACYNIGGQTPGAPLFHAALSVNTPTESITGMSRITTLPQPVCNLVGYLPEGVIGLMHHYSRIPVGSKVHSFFVHLHHQHNGLSVADGGILKHPFLGN